ncbi:MAG: PDGLE domain-containing protein [Elusimicrobiota bacterium]|jgi:ABC-type arginine transport system permease subunit|nr:PDGLE domain-containing protein [Elusimicrobiota bacterium]
MTKNKKTLFAFIVPIAIVFLASLFASSYPDTLEALAIKYGFDQTAKEMSSVFTDYGIGALDNEFLSTFLAGLIGLFLLFALYKAISFTVKRALKK